jgi:cytochrome b561
MKLRNTEAGWGLVARSLHWSIAALVFAQFALGWMAASWHLSPTKLNLFVWHKSIGMMVLVLALLRLLWRFGNSVPAAPAGAPAWERTTASAAHALLYVLLVAMPLDGWLLNSAAGVPFSIFWTIPLPPLVAPDPKLADACKLAHFWMFILLAAVVAGHAAAALRHHFIKRNDVLIRMIFDK